MLILMAVQASYSCGFASITEHAENLLASQDPGTEREVRQQLAAMR
jgi:hypothetical protein